MQESAEQDLVPFPKYFADFAPCYSANADELLHALFDDRFEARIEISR
jgi:hypothetical protein